MATATIQRPQPQRPAPAVPAYLLPRKKTMSITQTYYLAHKARAKLSHEAARSDHNLRLLVGHANLLDSLMLDLADAEREQESWFNQSLAANNSRAAVEEPEEDWRAEDADSDSSDSDDDFEEDEDIEMGDAVKASPAALIKTTPVPVIRIEEEDYDEMEEDDLEEDYAHLELVRTPSHSSPPELDHDEDSSEDEAMPPSPPTAMLAFDEKAAKEDEDQLSQQESFYSEGFYLPPRNPARLVSAISVY